MITRSPKRKSLMLAVTHTCNLDCVYCYEGNKTKEKMSLDIAKQMVTKYLSADHDEYDEVEIHFHGGEPFLRFTLIEELCEWTWSKSWKKPYIFFATTNGTLVHGFARTWVQDNKERFSLALSLDGTPAMHNRNRSNSYEKIEPRFFCDNWPNQPVKMTVSAETLHDMAEGIIYLHGLGFQVQCNLAQGVDWTAEEYREILAEQLELLVDYYLTHPEVQPCDLLTMDFATVGLLTEEGIRQSGIKKETPRNWCGIGTSLVATDVDGKEYPCHLFLPISAGDKSDSYHGIDFGDWKKLCDPRCLDCLILPVCPTCYAMNLLRRGDPSKRDDGLCELTKLRVLACSKMQATMLARSEQYHHFDGISDQQKLYTLIGIQEVQKQFLVM